MTSNNEQLDAAEQNILYLKELKAVIFAKNKLLKLKNLAIQRKDFSDNVDHQTNNLIVSMLNKSCLNSATFRIILDIFTKKNIINNESAEEQTQLQEFKEKLYKTLQELNKSITSVEKLYQNLYTFSGKRQKNEEEVLLLKHKHKSVIQQNSITAKAQKKDDVVNEAHEEKMKQLMSRVGKINLMDSLTNGLILRTNGIDWETNTELQEILRMCRNVYKLPNK